MVPQPFDFLYPQFYNFSLKQLPFQNHQITEINSLFVIWGVAICKTGQMNYLRKIE